MTKICKGCSVELQTENIEEKGYVPLEKYLSQEELICRRCFRLKHYQEIPKEIEDKELYKQIVKKSINSADIIMPIFDIIDLEASMTTEILDLIEDKRVIAVLNKVDLLPKYFAITEIAQWFKEILTENNIFPEAECYVSSKKSFGISGILKKIKSISEKKEIKIAVIGVSNVGKSSILNKLLGKNNLTTSKFSGTTKGSIKNTIKYKDIKITFIDTPGLIPDGRIGELLEPKTAVKLIPNVEIPRKTFNLKEGQYFMLDSLIYFKVNKNVSIQVFASKNVKFHITNEMQCKKLFNSDFFNLLTSKEKEEYSKFEKITKHLIIDSSEDLSISGLGFIVIKNGELDIDITYPKKVSIKTRNSISKINRESEMDFEW